MHLRHGATHDVLACWFGVDRSIITRDAVGEVRPLLAERGGQSSIRKLLTKAQCCCCVRLADGERPLDCISLAIMTCSLSLCCWGLCEPLVGALCACL
ncbi:transposase family protein [Streptomyces sp. DSM 40750]|uniref:transposase family protein n=1 Tax=Streptomyces sp. DSM 40750 TaxID=2801030 RepID=UPI003FA75764